MATTQLPAELINAYRTTDYVVTGEPVTFLIRIGEASVALIDIMIANHASGATFITAANPFSEQLSDEENQRRHQSLRRDLLEAGALLYEGYGRGQDSSWPAEISWLAIGVDRETALGLGERYRQNAIVWIDEAANAELRLLR